MAGGFAGVVWQVFVFAGHLDAAFIHMENEGVGAIVGKGLNVDPGVDAKTPGLFFNPSRPGRSPRPKNCLMDQASKGEKWAQQESLQRLASFIPLVNSTD